MRAWIAVVALLAGCAGSGEKVADEAAPDGADQSEASSVGADPASQEAPGAAELVASPEEPTDATPVPSEEPAAPAVEEPTTPVVTVGAPSWFEAGVQRGEGGVRVSVWGEADSVRGAQRAAIDTALKRLATELGRPAPTWEVLRSAVLPAGVGTYRAYVQLACKESDNG